MSAPLSKALRLEHKVRSLPVRQGDEVLVKSGTKKGQEGVIKAVYRKKFVIYIDRLTRDTCKGAWGVEAQLLGRGGRHGLPPLPALWRPSPPTPPPSFSSPSCPHSLSPQFNRAARASCSPPPPCSQARPCRSASTPARSRSPRSSWTATARQCAS